MIGLESRFINSPTGIKLAPTSNYGAGPGYYGQTIPNTGTPIIPFGVHSPDASINYTNTPQIPETSWWDKLKGSIDKDFLAYAAMSMGGGQSGRSNSLLMPQCLWVEVNLVVAVQVAAEVEVEVVVVEVVVE
jgi:hypothetical protein